MCPDPRRAGTRENILARIGIVIGCAPVGFEALLWGILLEFLVGLHTASPPRTVGAFQRLAAFTSWGCPGSLSGAAVNLADQAMPSWAFSERRREP